jgi:acyl carrier protein
LTALLLIAMVDSEYDVTLSGDDIRNSKTVQELFNVVASKK